MPKFDRKLWSGLLDTLKERHAPICRQWFYDELEPGQLHNGLLEVHTATVVQQNYLQKRCLEPFTEAAQEVTGQLVAVRFVCEAALPAEDAGGDTSRFDRPAGLSGGVDEPSTGAPHAAAERGLPSEAAGTDASTSTPPASIPRRAPHIVHSNGQSIDSALLADSMVLSPDYSFDNFITGPNNHLAFAAAQAVSNQPGTAYNPLFIHGGVGLGKTHLLQAICQAILNRRPQTQVLYVSCDAFINQFMACVGAGKMNEFRHHYRHVDLLVIDDIHFLGQRERTQEEFFHTFNELYQSDRQIVLSSDAAPDEIPNLEERLVSRFQWGLVTKVVKPTYETRLAILKAKADLRGFAVPPAVFDYLARKIDSNARELEGAITTLQGHSALMKRPVDMALVREVYGEPAVVPQANRATLQHIVDAVTTYYNVKLSDLQSRRRHKSVTEPRQVCMWLARKRTRFSLEEIGGYFGGRDHTTVMHSIDKVQMRLTSEPGFDQQINHLLENVDRATGQIVGEAG